MVFITASLPPSVTTRSRTCGPNDSSAGVKSGVGFPVGWIANPSEECASWPDGLAIRPTSVVACAATIFPLPGTRRAFPTEASLKFKRSSGNSASWRANFSVARLPLNSSTASTTNRSPGALSGRMNSPPAPWDAAETYCWSNTPPSDASRRTRTGTAAAIALSAPSRTRTSHRIALPRSTSLRESISTRAMAAGRIAKTRAGMLRQSACNTPPAG